MAIPILKSKLKLDDYLSRRMGEEGYLTLNGLDRQLNWHKEHAIGGMPTKFGRLREQKVALLCKAVSLYEKRSILDGPDSDGEEEASTWVVFPHGTFTNECQSEGHVEGKGKGKVTLLEH